MYGETGTAEGEEMRARARADVYGSGFRKYAAEYPIDKNIMSCFESPFKPQEKTKIEEAQEERKEKSKRRRRGE